MSTYQLASATHTETNVPGVGTLAFDFPAGNITPADETEKNALDLLVASGIAVIATDSSSKKTSTKASEPSVAPTPSEE